MHSHPKLKTAAQPFYMKCWFFEIAVKRGQDLLGMSTKTEHPEVERSRLKITIMSIEL
jgi:hypothetical protein